MAVFLVNPRYALHLWREGLRSAADFLKEERGLPVSAHRSRDVCFLNLQGVGCYLKRQRRIPWKERWASRWAGFGFCSQSYREWQVLSALRETGQLAPEPMAVGETPHGAFLLVRALPEAIDLPALLRQGLSAGQRRDLTERVAVALAELHGQGLSHPDVFAKHVFVHWNSGQVSFVDFQRSSKYSSGLPWRQRARDLAALAASLHPLGISRAERLRFLKSYLQAAELAPGLCWRLGHEAVARRVRTLMGRRKLLRLQEATAPMPELETTVLFQRVKVAYPNLRTESSALLKEAS